MDITQLVEFASNHPLLFTAFAAILAMLIGTELRQRISGISQIEPGEATRMVNHENAVIVDMREDKDYLDGHIVNAVHAPSGSESIVKKLEKYKERPVIVYCRSGHQSSGYCNRLRKQGFTSVYNLAGGILAWQKAGLPLLRGD